MRDVRRDWIGRGVLNWRCHERITDRYGAVHLSQDRDGEELLYWSKALMGRRGRLLAIVRETRPSRHIGDFFRGFQPQRPSIGEELALGNGTVFLEHRTEIGLRPDDGREHDWLDPRALYRLHEQTVDLYLETDQDTGDEEGTDA